MISNLSDKILLIGKRGEIFTTKAIREEAGLKEGGRVRASVVQGKLVLEAIPTLEEVLRKPVAKIELRKAERMSEEAQREHGILG